MAAMMVVMNEEMARAKEKTLEEAFKQLFRQRLRSFLNDLSYLLRSDDHLIIFGFY